MRRFAVLCASAILMLSVSACGDDDSNDEGKAGDPASPTSSESVETPTDPTTSESPTDPMTSESPTDDTTDPTTSDFCTAATAEGFDSGGFTEIKGWAEGMKGVTPPDDMSDDEKEGMDLLVSMVDDANSEKELNAAGEKVSKDDQAKLTAFITYVTTNCK